MSMFSRIFNFRSRDKPANTLPGSAFSFLFGGSSSGKAVNERTAISYMSAGSAKFLRIYYARVKACLGTLES